MFLQVAVRADPRLGQGDPTGNGTAALASELFQQHSQLVLAICRRLLVDPAEAEDAMQQTFLYAYRSLLAGREPRQPAAWLASIARNESLNRIRARTREPVADQLSDRAAGSPDALNAAIASEDLRALGHTIQNLPTQQREALLLHEFCGLRYEEVAAAIGVSESAIGSLLFRARSRLRFLLQRAYGLLPVPWLWDLARGPGVKVAALPAVAKVGTAAVAVSLATGTAVVIEREVETPKKPAPPPARVSEAAAQSNVLRATPIGEAVPEQRSARPSSPTIVQPARRAHAQRSAGAANGRPVRAATADDAQEPPGHLVSAAHTAWAGKAPTWANKGSRSPSAHAESARSSTRAAKVEKQHASGRSTPKTPPAKKAGKPKTPKSAAQGSPVGSYGDPKGNAHTGSPAASKRGPSSQSQQGNASENVTAGADQVGGRSTDHEGDGVPNHKER
jgi:RNA polymerase sigma-70 factor (ECF subfamily)